MARIEIHVIPLADGGWGFKRENSTHIIGRYETKTEAMLFARAFSKAIGAELIPHGLDGKIQNPDSHGNDPCPPRDKC